MFKIHNYFQCSGIFSDTLIKKFEESFIPQNNSRVWTTPGHIIFTNNTEIRTCDARPYDFSISPSEVDTDELLTAVSPVLDIVFDTQSSSTRMFVVLLNGDVQIFEYRILLYEWARIGYFNLNIVSPNSNNNHNVVSKVLISFHQNMVYWSEKNGNGSSSFDLHKREIPLQAVREITQSAIGIPQKLLKNCTHFELSELRDNLCVVPTLPNSICLYLILSARSHAWLYHIDGKLLWRGVIGDRPLDFISLCAKTSGLWHPTGHVRVCEVLNVAKNYAYILHNDTVLCITPNGEIHNKTTLNISAENQKKCYIMLNYICLFSNDALLHVYDLKSGDELQHFDLSSHAIIGDLWTDSSCMPSIGFCSGKTVYKLKPKPLPGLMCDLPCTMQTQAVTKQEYFHVFSILRDLLHHEFRTCDVPKFRGTPKVMQSDALLFAVLQTCRENGFEMRDFPFASVEELLLSRAEFPKTKLRELLELLAECFAKLERCQTELCSVSD